jgi:hypothetical protein
MMRIGLALGAAGLLASTGARALGQGDDPSGRWEGRLEDGRCERERGGDLCLELKLERGRRWNQSSWGISVNVDELDGLEARSAGVSRNDVRFELRRDAGTIRFEGDFEDGSGSGRFTFSADRDYQAALERAGYGDTSDPELLTLAVHDVSRSTLTELDDRGYRGDLDNLIAFAVHGVTPRFIDELDRLGYRRPTADQLIALRVHGVTPDYIEEMSRDRSRPSLDDLVAMRVHGVDGEFRRELADAGLEDDDLDGDDLTALKIHGADPRLIKAVRALGEQVDADELVSLSVQGVTPEYVERMAEIGLRNLDVDGLVSLKVQGVGPEWVRDMVAAGIENLDVDELVGAKVQGIDGEYVREMARAGFDHLDLDDLIGMKVQGVTEEFAREFRRDEPDGDVDDLIDAWVNGWDRDRGHGDRGGRHRHRHRH